MTTLITNVFLTFASLSMVCGVVHADEKAPVEVPGAVQPVSADLLELVNWHADMVITSGACMYPPWTSAGTATDPQRAAALDL